MLSIDMNLFSIEMVKVKSVTIKIKERVLHLKNKMRETIDYTSQSDKLYYLQIMTTKYFFTEQQTLSAIHDNKILRVM